MSIVELPKSWRWVSIGFLCTPIQLVDIKNRSSEDFRYIDISSIDNQQKAITNVTKVSFNKAPSRARQIVETNDVLVSTTRPSLNAVALTPNDLDGAICSTGFCVLRPRQNLIEPEYLFAWVRHPYYVKSLVRVERGIGYPAVSDKDVRLVKIPLPTLPEQRRIVSIVREVDELNRKSRKWEDTAKGLYAATFEYLFGIGAPTPKHPNTLKLKELLKRPLTSGFSPTADEKPPGIPVLTLAAITDFGLDETQVKYYPVEDYQGSGGDLEIDDILITRSNTTELVGKAARYKGKPSPVIYPDLTIRIRLKDAEDSAYVENFLRSPHMVSTIRRLARGTSGSMKKISQRDIRNFDVLSVSEEERQKFKNQVNEIDEIIACHRLYASRTKKLFWSLIAQGFTGELTARWRGHHEAELIEAARQRDSLLSQSISVELSGGAMGTSAVSGELTVIRYTPPERQQIVADLSRKQQRVLELANSMEGYFTLPQLSQARPEAGELSHGDIRQGLQLLAALGLVMRVRVGTEPTKDQLIFTPADRRILPSQDDSRLRDLDRLGASGG
jgi:type I restriction enzyme S subunit